MIEYNNSDKRIRIKMNPFAYRRINHMNEFLNNISDKHSIVPDDLIEKIKIELDNYNLEYNLRNIKSALRNRNEQRYYNYAPSIMTKLTGEEPPNIDERLEFTCLEDDNNEIEDNVLLKKIQDEKFNFDNCGICLERMTLENHYVLKCKHMFHKGCIDSWLQKSRTCPYCRDYVTLSKILKINIPQRFNKMTIRKAILEIAQEVFKHMNDVIKELYPDRQHMLYYGYILKKIIKIFINSDKLLERNKMTLKEMDSRIVPRLNLNMNMEHDRVWNEIVRRMEIVN